MPTVTNIKKQKKRADRVSVYVDGRYSFSLSTQQLNELKLSVGSEVSQTEIEQFTSTSATGKLLDKAFRQLARRPRSRWEMQDYLRRKDATEEQIDEVIGRLDTYGYLDDKAFAESWVRSRRALKPTSQKKLQFELKKKRVPSKIIDEVLDEDATNEIEQLKQLIVKKRRQTRYQEKQKLMAYCARQGFHYSDIKQALEELDD